MAHARTIVDGMATAIWMVANAETGPRDDVPEAAETCARELANLYTTSNDRSLDALFAEWVDAADIDFEFCADCEQSTADDAPSPHVCGESVDVDTDEIISDVAFGFGFDLAMLAMDYPTDAFNDDEITAAMKLREPNFEVSIAGDELVWTGGVKEKLYSTNPGSPMTGPGWDAARQKLRSAARGGRKNPSAIDDLMEDISVNPSKIRLFKHPEDPHTMRSGSSSRDTLRYRILPGPELGKTPRVARAVRGKKKRNPSDITRCAGCDTATHTSELDDRDLCATCAAATGMPHARDGSLRFPFVCQHCGRAIAELRLDPGTYIDATSLTEACPANPRGHRPR